MELTFIVPAFNEELNVEYLFETFEPFWVENACKVIFVNDGSTDATLETLRTAKREREYVSIVNLSRNFGKDQALSAGISVVNETSNVVAIDADGQHTVQATLKLLETLKQNEAVDIVFGARKDRNYQSFTQKFTSNTLYKLLNIGHPRYQIDQNVGDFFIARPNVVRVMKEYKVLRPFWKGFYGYLGFEQKHVEVEIADRHLGKTKFNFSSQLSLATDSLVAFVKWPLRFIFTIGLIISLFSFIYLGYTVITFFITKETSNGFYTLLALQLGFGGLTLTCLGVIAEYIGMILDQVSTKPPFIIKSIE